MAGDVFHQTCSLLWSQDIAVEGSHLREGGGREGRKERVGREKGMDEGMNGREGWRDGWREGGRDG